MSEVFGTVTSQFEGVRDAFGRAQADDPGGAQLCIYRNGEPVVDLWTGRDVIGRRGFESSTLTIIASCTKALTATCLHMLQERGLVDWDAPVSEYWPEFAANGKESITLRHVLSHTSGLFAFPPEDGIADSGMFDWDACVSSLAAMRPLFEPGSAFYYHAATFGFLIGEVVRRISGKSLGTFLRDEIAAPLDLEMWIGLPEEQEHRMALQFMQTTESTTAERREAAERYFESRSIDVTTPLMRAFLGSIVGDAEMNARHNSREGHTAETPSGNGISTARSFARFYAALIGEVDGVRLLKPETVAAASKPQTDNLQYPWPLSEMQQAGWARFGLGYQPPRSAVPMLGPGSFGHAGGGGRLGFAHPASGLAFAFTCNNLMWQPEKGPDSRWIPVLDELSRTIS